MLKERYIKMSAHGELFSTTTYLLDHNPGQSINSIRRIINKISKEELFKIFKDFGFGVFKHIYNEYYENDSNNCIVYLDMTESTNLVWGISIRYSTIISEDKIKELLKVLEPKEDENKGFKINLVTISRGEPNTITKYSKHKTKIDKDNSYNLDCSLNTVIDDIKSDKSGLIIFNGNPGGGKTSLIKYLAQELQDKNFFFLSNSNLDILSNPSFTNYCLDHLQNSILVLEDCEKALTTRDLNKGYDISNILNITDGIMGDLLNIKIIATLNTADKLDTALLRKGRLIRQIEFKPLRIEQVINLSNSLNLNIENPKEMMLCEVYNQESNKSESLNKTAIGFAL